MAENANMIFYDAFRAVPEKAKKAITGGRLNGKTDINPMWRIKALTEQFGPCGIGWWYEITDKRLQEGNGGEVAAFVDILLYYKYAGEVSLPIPGTGGSAFVAKEKNGLYTSDECYKMALTDALSVACKALGIGADVYWDKDDTKYTKAAQEQQKPAQEPPKQAPTQDKPFTCAACQKPVQDAEGKTAAQIAAGTKKHTGVVMCVPCFKQYVADQKAAAEAASGNP
jgi:hypothetical protein